MTKTIKMTRDQHAKWDTGLRSGEYQQGMFNLCTYDGKHCCLGVLQAVLDGDVERSADGSALPLPSKQWLDAHGIVFLDDNGHKQCYPFLHEYQRSAVGVNDALEKSFVEIADAINNAVEYIE